MASETVRIRVVADTSLMEARLRQIEARVARVNASMGLAGGTRLGAGTAAMGTTLSPTSSLVGAGDATGFLAAGVAPALLTGSLLEGRVQHLVDDYNKRMLEPVGFRRTATFRTGETRFSTPEPTTRINNFVARLEEIHSQSKSRQAAQRGDLARRLSVPLANRAAPTPNRPPIMGAPGSIHTYDLSDLEELNRQRAQGLRTGRRGLMLNPAIGVGAMVKGGVKGIRAGIEMASRFRLLRGGATLSPSAAIAYTFALSAETDRDIALSMVGQQRTYGERNKAALGKVMNFGIEGFGALGKVLGGAILRIPGIDKAPGGFSFADQFERTVSDRLAWITGQKSHEDLYHEGLNKARTQARDRSHFMAVRAQEVGFSGTGYEFFQDLLGPTKSMFEDRYKQAWAKQFEGDKD